MTLLAHCHTYGDNANSGADKMLQSLLEYLASRGITCKAVIDNCPIEYELNGVQVKSNRTMLGEAYENCDAVIIHLVMFTSAVSIAKRFNKPVIHLAHNDKQSTITEGYVIYNSQGLKDKSTLNIPSIVVNPPVSGVKADHFKQPYITLVNTCINKGGEILIALAKALPHMKFLGVQGGYGKQILTQLPNLYHRPYREFVDYSDTRILLVPSKTESWSMCAAEAMANGIPVVCSDLPGLRENCGDAAFYCNTIAEYVAAINKLQDEQIYLYKVQIGYTRNQNSLQLDNLYNFICEMKEKKEVKPVKEKKEIKPIKEKKIIHVGKS